jgi:hypothetical protein
MVGVLHEIDGCKQGGMLRAVHDLLEVGQVLADGIVIPAHDQFVHYSFVNDACQIAPTGGFWLAVDAVLQ